LTNGDLAAGGHFAAENTGRLGGDFVGDFVGFESQKGVPGVDVIAVIFEPLGEEAGRDGFSDGWDFYFDAHIE
jgi:hypothetical protein